ncbi:MAG TPA: glutaredoxin family protein, partial [Mycobacterium sp.]|nr:glutaredoxin family protein [Mycobacterium sp.]
MSRRHVELLTRAGCTLCQRVYDRLAELSTELDF